MNNLNLPELLSPVGGMQNLYAAVAAGCDSVYLGGENFSARASAENFSNSEIKEAIDFCHLRGVKLYVTINTIYKNSEITQILEFVREMYEYGADAFILQDFGIASYIKKNFPHISLHASTQMTAHSLPDVVFLEKAGFSRIVLSRELSIEEIKHITQNTNCEIEVFIHGALCVCYSGQCLMSSLLGQRSGNRGKCAQSCRMKYDLIDENGGTIDSGYLLSPKDAAAYNLISELKSANVTTLKIEGRMKNPEYVAIVTSFYRAALDSIEPGLPIDEDEIKKLTQIFNRGGSFTSGYFNNYAGTNMISKQTPKSTGMYVGKVINYNTQTDKCTIWAEEELRAGDGIEIWTSEPHVGTNINKNISVGQRFDVTVKGKINKGDSVYKSYDKKLADLAKHIFIKDVRKLTIYGDVLANVGKPLKLTLRYNNISVESTGDLIEVSEKTPITKEKLLTQLGKTGSTPFKIKFEKVDIDKNIFVNISQVNALRREATSQFETELLKSFRREKSIENSISFIKKDIIESKNLCVSVTNYEQFISAVIPDVYAIYVESNTHFINNASEYIESCKAKGIKLFVSLPKIARFDNKVLEIIQKLNKTEIDGFLVRTYGELLLTQQTNKEIICDYTFNVTNNLTVKALENYSQVVTLSAELNFNEINNIDSKNTEVIVYGRNQLMVTCQCPVGLYAANKKEGKFCSLKNKNMGYALKDRKDAVFPIVTNCETCEAYILNSVPLNMLKKFHDLQLMPSTNIRLNFTTEQEEDINKIINAYLNMLHNQDVSGFSEESVTYGHFYRGVL